MMTDTKNTQKNNPDTRDTPMCPGSTQSGLAHTKEYTKMQSGLAAQSIKVKQAKMAVLPL